MEPAEAAAPGTTLEGTKRARDAQKGRLNRKIRTTFFKSKQIPNKNRTSDEQSSGSS